MRRHDCHDLIKRVAFDYEIVRATFVRFREIATEQPRYIADCKFALSDLRRLTEKQHDIYFIWMFACFESSLRSYWRASRKLKRTRSKTANLIDSVAARCDVPRNVLNAVHNIRDFRNGLVHEETETKIVYSMNDASKWLNKFLSRLPLEW